MTLKPEEKKALMEYRIERCKETIVEAQKAINSNSIFGAVNRIYYSNFYIISALALKFDFITSKHSQLIGWFNREFIKKGLVDQKYGAMLTKSFDSRTKGDYGDFMKFSKEEVEVMFNEMKEFVSEIEKLINL